MVELSGIELEPFCGRDVERSETESPQAKSRVRKACEGPIQSKTIKAEMVELSGIEPLASSLRIQRVKS
jgi:hypothetical protein